jgi:predicted GNAT family acetyltransferase
MSNSILEVIESPTPKIIQDSLNWLAQTSHENLGTEVFLSSFVRNQKEKVNIVREEGQVRAVSVVTPAGLWFLESANALAAQKLVSQICRIKCPRKITVSEQVATWIRSTLVKNSQLVREHKLLAMRCSKTFNNIDGRWASLADIDTLQCYQNAYNSERKTSIQPNWENLLTNRQVAVLERDGHIVSVIKRCGMTTRYACIGGTFTFHNYRRRGFATQLIKFTIAELLRERSFVHLMVDDDNLAAIGLYHSLSFQEIGKCYMAYLT